MSAIMDNQSQAEAWKANIQIIKKVEQKQLQHQQVTGNPGFFDTAVPSGLLKNFWCHCQMTWCICIKKLYANRLNMLAWQRGL